MSHRNAIIAMLAIMSISALVGVFTVQVADAQLPSLSISERGVAVLNEELDFFAGASGVIAQTEVFGLTVDGSGVEFGGAQVPSLSVSERGVGVLTEVYSLKVDPSGGVIFDPR
jgi:hypothetical protein